MKICLRDSGMLREMMIKKGFTQRGLGRATGVSSPYIAQILNGDRKPGPEIAKKFADALETEFDVIFFIEDGNKSNQKSNSA